MTESTSGPNSYHQRIDPWDFDLHYRDIPEADWDRSDPVSPFDVWSMVKLRAKCPQGGYATEPTDLVVWSIGEPPHPAATKMGGLPAWPAGRPFPLAKAGKGAAEQALGFLGQFNFEDSRDLLPPLPAGLLSLWVGENFPFEEGSLRTFWLDPAAVVAADARPETPAGAELPENVFHACLYRTWEPVNPDKTPVVRVEHQFEAYRNYSPDGISGTKIGGLEMMPQGGGGEAEEQFLCQFLSIQAAEEVPYPWVNRSEPLGRGFGENDIHSLRNCYVLGDMGGVSFHLKRDGEVRWTFECG